jgi:acyl carrier protein
MTDEIKGCLVRIGLPAMPDFDTSSLADCGLDSLFSVMLVFELERAFQLRIPATDVTKENFASVETLATLIGRIKGRTST